MTQQRGYTDDLFGLRTLDQSHRLNLTIVSSARHADWTGNHSAMRLSCCHGSLDNGQTVQRQVYSWERWQYIKKQFVTNG